MENQRLRTALAFARRDIGVFPLRPRQKEPLGELAPHAAHSASTDAEQIRAWWCLSPSANVGVSCRGLLIVDEDLRKGGSLAALEERFGPLPFTWQAVTGSGGRHVYFRLPAGCRIRGGNDKFGRGLDAKTGAGAYVVAPSSQHPDGGLYRWSDDHHPRHTPLVEAPAYYLAPLLPPPPAPPAMPKWVPANGGSRRLRAYADAALRNREAALAATPEGGRQDAVFAMGASLGRFVHAGALSFEAVLAAAIRACQVNGWLAEGGEKGIRRNIARGIAIAAADPLPEWEPCHAA